MESLSLRLEMTHFQKSKKEKKERKSVGVVISGVLI